MLLAVSQGRLLAAQSRQMDLEWQSQLIAQAKMQMANTVGAMFTLSADLEPESPTYQALMARMAAVQQIEKSLQLQQQRIEVQYKAVKGEIESLKKLVDDGAQNNFKYLS
jgi:capsule polysaccharide export protein KpsE/RkpR